MVFVLNYVKPCKHVTLEILNTYVFWLVLNVKYRRQITVKQHDIFQEEISLLPGRRLVAPEMISTPYKAIVPCLGKVLLEHRVEDALSLGGFYKDETNRAFLNHRIAQQFPVNLSLMVADVYSTDFIAFRIFGIAIQSPPPETERPYEYIIKNPNVKSNNAQTAQPPGPPGITAHDRMKKAGRTAVPAYIAPALPSAPARFSCARITFLRHWIKLKGGPSEPPRKTSHAYSCSKASVLVGQSHTSAGPQYCIGPG